MLFENAVYYFPACQGQDCLFQQAYSQLRKPYTRVLFFGPEFRHFLACDYAARNG